MANFQNIKDRIFTCFSQSQVETSPFPYIEVPECLDVETFNLLRSQLPNEGLIEKKASSLTNMSEMNRLTVIIGQHPMEDLVKEEFWRTFCRQVILHDSFIQLLFTKFYGPSAIITKAGEKDGILYFKYGGNLFSAEATIYRDKGGYELEVHTDSPKRVLTAIWYLPPMNESMKQYGTALYKSKDPKFKDPLGGRLPFENFDKVKTLPFVPQYAFAFLRGDQSFHAVEKFDHPRTTRDTLGIHVRKCKKFPDKFD